MDDSSRLALSRAISVLVVGLTCRLRGENPSTVILRGILEGRSPGLRFRDTGIYGKGSKGPRPSFNSPFRASGGLGLTPPAPALSPPAPSRYPLKKRVSSPSRGFPGPSLDSITRSQPPRKAKVLRKDEQNKWLGKGLPNRLKK